MSRISRRNLKDFCRACLSGLEETTKYDLKSIPQLKIILIIFTSLDTLDDEYYPQSLCQSCYSKLLDFQEFRRSILDSARKIDDILKNDSKSVENNSDDDNNDNGIQMFIPELVMREESFVTEEADLKDESNDNEVQVKNEVETEVEIEAEAEAEQNGDSHLFESNTMCVVYNNDKNPNIKYDLSRKKREKKKKTLKCPTCVRKFYKQVHYDAHIRGVHKGIKKAFVCNECEKGFSTYDPLHYHMIKFHSKFKCDFTGCDSTFRKRETLETHKKIEHSGVKEAASIDLNREIALHQQQLLNEKKLDYICPICSKRVCNNKVLLKHIKLHGQNKDVVGEAKVTSDKPINHMQQHNTNSKKFKCPQCPREFAYKYYIPQHIRIVHIGERPYVCSYCPKSFGTRSGRTTHETLHSAELKFECDRCPKKCRNLSSLKAHLATHKRKLQKHICKFCSMSFASPKNLSNHEKRHFEKQQQQKQFICKVCQVGFFKLKELRVHSKVHLNKSDKSETKMKTDDNKKEKTIQERKSKELQVNVKSTPKKQSPRRSTRIK